VFVVGPRFEVTTNGVGVVGHAGAGLLVELADRLGLTSTLDCYGRATPRLVPAMI
jgi:hypothetical protein